MPRTNKKIKDFIRSLGRRKRAVVRLRLFKGKGQTLVNDVPIEQYFKDIPSIYYFKPFDLTQTIGKYHATARVAGGGKVGQVEAFVLALSRALVQTDESFRKALRTAGLMTRDPRERERRKFGLAQSARARKQSPKR